MDGMEQLRGRVLFSPKSLLLATRVGKRDRAAAEAPDTTIGRII